MGGGGGVGANEARGGGLALMRRAGGGDWRANEAHGGGGFGTHETRSPHTSPCIHKAVHIQAGTYTRRCTHKAVHTKGGV